jgi:aspyridone synthetase (hybrid polyketide synthase/nonribosomal peptide synthetase)
MKEPIAIVGSACRFPGGASSPSKLWDLLKDPKDVLSEFDKERLNLSQFYNANGEHHGSTNVPNKSYCLTEDHRLFDASFFKVNPLEVDGMDPQQRFLLETVYEALESAGCTLEQIQGTLTSVFVGVMTGDFSDIQVRDTEVLPTYSATGTSRSILSNRISYFFDLKGPSVTLDTACSSSLVALHQAVQDLRSGDSKYAIVAGSNLLLDPTMYIAESKLHMLSPTSRSRMWDKDADGYARGEGFAALFLKPLSQALRDGDHIECLVRETGVNSDGRTKGITVPSSIAQKNLIQQTYRNAGLDPLVDRCQFFECHGTGTLAGDPREAQAIQEAFFPSEHHVEEQTIGKLFVGSIKTVVGHLEGCAGLAGILKASLAIQHGIIPPNMHFNELNPAIIPYYDHLQVVARPILWPDVAGQPRRASVNSFGFGGTNAHAILESYHPGQHATFGQPHQLRSSTCEAVAGPFLFSANTESSLLAMLKEFSSFFKLNPSVNLSDLSWVLQSRRTTFPVKACVSGSTQEKLLGSIDKLIENAQGNSSGQIGTRTPVVNPNEAPGILGIFTGQGAQWATMGRQLYHSNPLFRKTIEQCESSLANLPDPPSWSLKQELLANPSRLSEAAISQPLCTALQIALVDLVQAAGVKLDAVVGHSSGEMAATYAAGILSAQDAIRIAYYRGLHAKFAGGARGQKGAMMAVSLSFDGATSFCAGPSFSGRLGVAASNSPTSVTLSGDQDAILEAKQIFDEEKTFARILQVDTAYHSHHMLACSEGYVQSLKACNIQVNPPRSDCIWISSVRGDVDLLEDGLQTLKDQYWVDNMVSPVLFSQAIECALWNGGPFDMAIEVGPHPALKGPATQTFKAALGSTPPYVGFMKRGENEVEAFSEALGSIWSYLGPSFVDFHGYRQSYEHAATPKMLKHLPSYPWDHDKIYWKESRISRNFRFREQRYHELLGRRVPDDSEYEMRWRNVFRQIELPWTRGHQFQGQVIFPGAGYVSMAVEASKSIAEGRPVKFVEVRDLSIPRGLVIGEGSAGVETVFTVKILNRQALAKSDAVLEAEFACYMCADERIGCLEKGCGGRLFIHFGQPSFEELPPKPTSRANFAPVDMERFYEVLSGIGLDYSGVFRTLTSASRLQGRSKASASWPGADLGPEYTIHPAILDIGFQAGFAAFASPATDVLCTAYLPTSIDRVIVNPNITYRNSSGAVEVAIDAFVTKSSSTSIEVDVHLADPNGNYTGLQVEGLNLKSIAEPKARDDRLLFAENHWNGDVSYGVESVIVEEEGPQEIELIHCMQRTALYYLQSFLREIRPEEVEDLAWPHQRLYEATSGLLAPVREGIHPLIRTEWLADSYESLMNLAKRFPGSVDLDLMHAAGKNLVPVARGETQILEHLMKDNMLQRLYTEGHGARRMNMYLAQVLKQITYKYPRLKILEIGAGTGGTTEHVFDAIDSKFSTYTYTDISSGFFEKASERFKDHKSKMTFKVLDIETDIAEQEFSEGSYDVVIAANVLHATRIMSETMKHTRSLLRPGGYLLLLELTGNLLHLPVIMGGLPGWWLGAEEGRRLGPALTPVQWNELLQATGFSGVDYITYDMRDALHHSVCLIVSQAIDEKYELLRDPLSSLDIVPEEEHLLILGGQTLPVAKVVRGIQKLLAPWKHRTTVVHSIESLGKTSVAEGTSIICLTELDKPLFSASLTPAKLNSLQDLFTNARNVLWITGGRRSACPYSNMMPGIGRALSTELPHVNLQYLDFDGTAADARVIVETFLRLALRSSLAGADYDALWMSEPELVFDGERTLIPRICMDKIRNERFNASRRLITSKVPAKGACVELQQIDESLHLVQKNSVLRGLTPPGYARIEVKYSTTLPSKDQQETYYLCLGHVSDSGQVAFAVSRSVSSVIETPLNRVFISEQDQACDPAILYSLASHFIARIILSIVPTSGPILIYEPENGLAEAILRNVDRNERDIFFATSKVSIAQTNWVSIHPQATERAIQQLLPRGLTCFVDLSGSASDKIKACLPRQCSVQAFEPSLLIQNSPSCFQSDSIAIAHMKATEAVLAAPKQTVPIQDLVGLPYSSTLYPNVVDWSHPEDLTVKIEPLDTSGIFSSTKTYFMVGMTGEMGQSLCRWMANNGAVHFVLASRSAAVDEGWLEEMRALGTNIKVYKMDVCSRESVRSTVTTARETMPPIAGVCNAAMVLHDKLFIDTDAETVNRQLQPKVDGTKHLDEMFSEGPLDFFILFGSLASVLGNGGQSIYHAANLFMTSLAAQRRERGLTASVMWIGMVTDIGYIARTGRQVEDQLRRRLYMPLSESDVHQLFAETVLAGRPESSGNADIILGMYQFVDSPNQTVRPPWYSNPRFSHLILEDEAPETHHQTDSTAAKARQKLETAESEDVATEAVQELFSTKLEAMMQLPPNTVRANAPLLELGCDSLLAVEIRTWFLKELNVDVPLLKILGQETVAEICREVARKFLRSNIGKPQIYETPAKPTADESPNGATAGGSVEIQVDDQKISPSSSSESDSDMDDAASASSDTEDTNTESSIVASSPDMTATDSSCSMTPVTPPLEDMDIKQLSLDYFKRVEKMSFSQSRIWFLHTYLEDPTTYNITVSYNIKGKLQGERFRRALETVVSRHHILQTCFFAQPGSGELMQGVLSKWPSYFKHIKSGDKETAQRTFGELANCVWSLELGQTFRAVLITLAPDQHTVIFGYHHIVMDGVSWHFFLRDLNLAYQMIPLKPLRKQYADFSVEQICAAESGEFDEQLDFWQQEHSRVLEPLPLLPFSRVKTRKAAHNYNSHTISKEIDIDLVTKIKRASQELRVTPFHFYLTVVQVLLSRLLNTHDFCIGVTDANRSDESFAESVGFFLNLLPLRFQVNENDTFSTLAKKTFRTALAGFAQSKVPFDLILEKLSVPRSSSHSPIFQVAFNYRMGDMVQLGLGDCQMELTGIEDSRNPYDFAFTVTQISSKGTCRIQITSRDHLYTEEAPKLLMEMYVHLLDNLCTERSLPIQGLSLYDSANAQQAISIGRGRRVDHGWPDTISARLDLVQKDCENEIAVKDDIDVVTYSQLADRVNSLAITLLDNGLTTGSRVAVLCHPSIDTITCMLAILRIGCVYVPLDLSLPQSRHALILESCKPSLMLSHSRAWERAHAFDNGHMGIINVSELSTSGKHVNNMAQGSSPAFLLYTSGSTGTPKGISLSQAGFINYAAAKARKLSLGKEVVLQQSSTGFDMSIAQMFNALANGGTLIMVPQTSRGDPLAISKLMFKENVTFTIGTPSEYLMIVRYGRDILQKCSSWRHVCLGGEAISERLKEEFRQLGNPDLVLTDCYGPTEISAATTLETVPMTSTEDGGIDDFFSVGKPIPNSSIYILDEGGKPVPNGFPGEICVGGAGVARGYLDLPELTLSKFVEDPFALPEDAAKGWSKMYRTGDKGRLLEDGSLIFMGRLDGDTQIKLRGLRIEMDEVANTLLRTAQGSLSDVVVSVRGDPEFLVAHVVFAPGKSISDCGLRQLARSLPLPQYMCPSMIIPLERLPITQNGKIDRSAIQALPCPTQTSELQPRTTEFLTLSEGELRLLWQEVLHQTTSSVHLRSDSDFFMVGGSSLLLVKLQNSIREKIGVTLPISELYQASTLARMAARINIEKAHQLEQAIDWDVETAVPEDLITISSEDEPVQNRVHSQSREILLTGSTTFLGSAILSSLLSDSSVRKIHCVAVPPDCQQQLPESDKITLYPGSLLDPSLGLSQAQYAHIQSHIDQIIHAGSLGHCLNTYFSLRTPNYLSTRFLAELAIPRRIPFHLLSSNRVVLLTGHTSVSPRSVAAHPPPANGSEGFTAAKWASERFLEILARKTGLPVTIHRACAVIGDNAPSEDAQNALLRYSVLLRAVPSFKNMEGYFDFKDVGIVAADIAAATAIPQDSQDPVTFRHHSSGVKVPIAAFRRRMEQLYSGEFAELDQSEWLERAMERGIEPLIVSYLQAIGQRDQTVSFPFLGEI